MKMNRLAALAAACTTLASGMAWSEIVLYGREGFDGRSITVQTRASDLRQQNFNDRASSAVVYGGRWEVCSDIQFRGSCVVLRPGRYPELQSLGIGDRISSTRPVSRQARVPDDRYAAPGYPVYDARPRRQERLFEAEVVAVREVRGAPEQRCWVERQPVSSTPRSGNEIGGAVIGGILGGVLGHQVGSGRGNDLATGVGAIAGAAIGANVARDNSGNAVYTQDVRRCENVQASGSPAYYDVTYVFKGQEHRMQTTSPPPRTITVNGRGEPRVG